MLLCTLISRGGEKIGEHESRCAFEIKVKGHAMTNQIRQKEHDGTDLGDNTISCHVHAKAGVQSCSSEIKQR